MLPVALIRLGEVVVPAFISNFSAFAAPLVVIPPIATFPILSTRILSTLLVMTGREKFEVVPIACMEVALFPPSAHIVPKPADTFCADTFQLVPLLTNTTLSLAWSNSQEVTPSIVCEEVVLMVTRGTGSVALAFFTWYPLPVHAV